MPEHIRALLVVLVFSAGVFAIARSAVVHQLIPETTFKRWRKLWFLVTLALFLSHNIWLCLLLISAMLLIHRRQEAHVMGLYFVMLFVAPPISVTIPGFGIIDHFWVLNHYRLLALTLLLPTALSLARKGTTLRLGRSRVDWMVLGYLSLVSLLSFRDVSFTSGLRAVFSLWIDVFLLYYVASRSIRDLDGLRHAMTGYVLGAMVLSLVAVFEAMRGWQLYLAVKDALGLEGNLFGLYLFRSGLLRPAGTAGQSIILGYALMVALGFFLYLKEFLRRPVHRWLGLFLLGAGILASLSRGPWLATAFLVLVYVMLGPRPVGRLMKLTYISLFVLLLVGQLPFGQKVIDLLPVIGSQEQFNVEYREDLLENALPVIGRHLWFGSTDFLLAPELQVMIQGEGIIDIVNSYLGVALSFGVIGLFLYVGAFASAFGQVLRGRRLARKIDSGSFVLGRALGATLAAIMLIIYTLSSLFSIPYVYWAFIGLCVAYASVMNASASTFKEGAR
ncbi:O-antigen ligase family protein [Hydrogenophaga sp.]|uniref:O-antigen ligase family protein n=1 Tax=Hydrogenophaga sp. TaxID=1904254 RepID=UPI003D0DDE54